jgi:hypothetical protein
MADAKQKWDYLILSSGSEVDLAKQMNHAGHEGWELVNGSCAKDNKGNATWSAFLQRLSETPASKGPTSDTAKMRVANSIATTRASEPKLATPPLPDITDMPAAKAETDEESDFDLQL